MTIESKNKTDKPVMGVTRRNWLKLIVIFVLVCLTSFQIFYRRYIANNKVKSGDSFPLYEEATIKGPFSAYGYLEPRTKCRESCQANLTTVQISDICFFQDIRRDSIDMTIAFLGEKSLTRRYFVTLLCYDETGIVIGNIRNTFRDHRTFLDKPKKKKRRGMWDIRDLVSDRGSLMGRMNEGKHIVDIKYIQINVETYNDDSDEIDED